MNIIKQMFETPDTPSGKKRLNNLITRLGLGKKVKGDLMKDVVNGELGGGASGEITLNDIFNIHPYKEIIKEYPYPCTYDGIRWDPFKPTRIETITTGIHVISASYMNSRDFYFNKNGYGYSESGNLNVNKIPLDVSDFIGDTVEMYYCIVLNLSFILFYGPKEYTNAIIDELKQEIGF